YDIVNNALSSAYSMGAVGLDWQVAGFGNFSGRANETDMIMRNTKTGALFVYDIANNALASAFSMGTIGLDWSVGGFGSFGANPNESDMLMRNASTGALEVYDLYGNTIICGASDVGAPSIGFNIQLPREQEPNPDSTPELTFQFHSFTMRKMHLAMRAARVVAFPGGFGTLVELFEVLTLVQTRNRRSIPLGCGNRSYLTPLINFD